MKNILNLSGEWDVFVDFSNPVERYEEISKNKSWTKISVPGCWEQTERNKKSDGPVWYRKLFTVSEEWSGNPIAIHFEGVNYYSEVWLNGNKVGFHEGGWNGFELDISKTIEFSNENELLVKVYKQGEKYPVRECLAGFFPDVGVIFGGIWKPVTVKLLDRKSVV